MHLLFHFKLSVDQTIKPVVKLKNVFTSRSPLSCTKMIITVLEIKPTRIFFTSSHFLSVCGLIRMEELTELKGTHLMLVDILSFL